MTEPECRCGEAPYTDGVMCPVCLSLVVAEHAGRVERGEMSPMAGFAQWLILSGRAHDQPEAPR